MSTGPARRRSFPPKTTLITAALLRGWPLPAIDGALGKEGRGCVLVVGGSVEIPGAVVLAAVAALRAGAGKVQIATSRSVAPSVAVNVPEARVIGVRQDARGEIARHPERALASEISRCDALLVGPGMVRADGATDLAASALRRPDRPTLIVDAAALAVFAAKKPIAAQTNGVVITPHAGEMARLWGIAREQVTADPIALAREAAATLGIVVALKGAHTYVAAPDGRIYHNAAGNSGLGTAGSGDTLAGIIAGLAARGADAVQAAVWGVHLHARAGEVLAKKIGPLGFLAREILGEIPAIMGRLAR